MSEPSSPEKPASANLMSGEEDSTLFAHLVMQQANMALMLMGKVEDPSRQSVKDFDAARLFIDQLQMLQKKTKGNLTPEEAGLLKQTLMTLQMAFVEAVDSRQPAEPARQSEPKPATDAKPSEPQTATAPSEPAPEAHEPEHRPKFSKKY